MFWFITKRKIRHLVYSRVIDHANGLLNRNFINLIQLNQLFNIICLFTGG